MFFSTSGSWRIFFWSERAGKDRPLAGRGASAFLVALQKNRPGGGVSACYHAGRTGFGGDIRVERKKKLGRSQLELSTLGFGGTGLGNMYVAMSERVALDTLSAAYAAGMRYFDTAPLYGHGLSERRLGSGLRLFDDPGVVVSTKVGWRLRPAFGKPTEAGLFRNITAFARFNDYSYDGAMRSFEASLDRLGTERIDILLIHDVDHRNQGERWPEVFAAAMAGAYTALLSLREQGVVRAIGCG